MRFSLRSFESAGAVARRAALVVLFLLGSLTLAHRPAAAGTTAIRTAQGQQAAQPRSAGLLRGWSNWLVVWV